jgi:hypothetical protein
VAEECEMAEVHWIELREKICGIGIKIKNHGLEDRGR